jgi:imidazolonepropionase-like amidohydrolase
LEHMADPVAALALRAAKGMAADLAAGVTTVRCLGDKDFLDFECRRAVESGYLKGPRIITSGKGIRSSAGHGFVGYPFDGPEQIRTAIRDNIRAGADFIKFYVTGTLHGPGAIPCFFSRDEIALIAEEARRVGRPTAVHCIGGQGLAWCLDEGVDAIEHGFFVTDSEIEMLCRSSAYIVITPGFYMSDQRIHNLPEPLIAPHLKERAAAIQSMTAVISAGVPFAVGTDGVHGHGGVAKEIEYLTMLGASVADAIRAATHNAAEVCGIESFTGTLVPGKSADLIGIRGNPFEDITALAHVDLIMAQGALHTGNAGWEKINLVE